MFKRLFLALVLLAAPSWAAERFNGQCRVDAGTASALCTVTVYDQGTVNLASIFSDETLLVAKANPFTADANGQNFFYAADGRYDVVYTGGTPSVSTFTIADVQLGESASVGSVTSVAVSAPSILSVSGSPITTSGTIALSLATQSANQLFAGPTSGGAATPAFRGLVDADIPNLGTLGTGLVDGCVSVSSDNLVSSGAACGAGTVTSVAMTVPSILSVGGSPITGAGTLAVSLASQSQNAVFAGPTSGSGTPTFRSLVAADIPSLDTSKITTGTFADARISQSSVTQHEAALTLGNLLGTLGVTKGGTGLTGAALGELTYGSAANTLARLAGNTSATKMYLSQTGTGSVSAAPVWGAIQAADLPTGIDAAKISGGTVSNTEFDYLNGVTSALQTQIDGKVATTRNLTAGVGLSGGGDLSADRTFTFAPTELDALTWDAGTLASFVWTFDLSGTDPTITFESGEVTLSSLKVSDLDCTGNTNGGALTANASGVITCSDDDGGAGSGDAVEIEDGDNLGTFTAIDTTARFDDSGDINFAFADGGAGGPDTVTATVRADSVALTTDTTGNYVQQVADGTGIDGSVNSEGGTYTPTLDLTEVNSVTFGNNTLATITHTVDVTGTTNPVWSYSDGVANLSAGQIQEGGSPVLTQSDEGSGNGIDADTVDGNEAAAFALLAGLSGGQTLNGGTGASENLVLESTANATKGVIVAESPIEIDDQQGIRLREEDANGDNYVELISSANRASNYTLTLAMTGDCTGNTNGGALTINASNEIVCSDDDGGAGGSGDAVEVEDGDNLGTFTTIDTTARFEDQGDINFVFADGGAGGPDTITALVRADSVALSTDTTGNYVQQVADGTGIDGSVNSEGGTYTPTLDLTEVNSVTFGDNTLATITHTVDVTGTTNPVWSYSDGVANLSAGALQEGGNAVPNVTDNLSVFAATTSAQLAGVISDESGTGLLILQTSPTIVTPTIASFVNATHNHQAAAGGGQLDHGAALTGLTDDDHTQYALLAGRSGGQTFNGGTAASNNLVLESTTNATKGVIVAESPIEIDDQQGIRLREEDANGDNYFEMISSASRASNYTVTWAVTGDCTGSANGGALTINASNEIVCSDDDGGAGGGGDAIEIEDGENLGTFTAIDTTARFDDSGDINFTFADGGAGGPDVVTATIRANTVGATEVDLTAAFAWTGAHSFDQAVDMGAGAVNDDDCTGQQGEFWFDGTDNAFEFCNANSGTPAVLGGGGGSTTETVWFMALGAVGATENSVMSITPQTSGFSAFNFHGSGTSYSIPYVRFTNSDLFVGTWWKIPSNADVTTDWTLRFYSSSQSNTANVIHVDVEIACFSAGDTIQTAPTYNTAHGGIDIDEDGDNLKITSFVLQDGGGLELGSCAANDLIYFHWFRDATGDSSTLDLYYYGFELEYATT